jgi:hypothetical protein
MRSSIEVEGTHSEITVEYVVERQFKLVAWFKERS